MYCIKGLWFLYPALPPPPQYQLAAILKGRAGKISWWGEESSLWPSFGGSLVFAPDQPLMRRKGGGGENQYVLRRKPHLLESSLSTLPSPQLSGKVPPKARNLRRPWKVLQFYARERSTLEAAGRSRGRAGQHALLLQLPARTLRPRLAPCSLPPTSRLTACSPRLAAAPCWNPNSLGLENRATQQAVRRPWRSAAYLFSQHTF